jgi:putative glutamine amidotransferase
MHRPLPKPLVAVPACLKTAEDKQPAHSVGAKYLSAVSQAAEAIPVVAPALGAGPELESLLDRVDGVMLSGSPSNVHPTHYGEAPSPAAEPYDEARDMTTLLLIRSAGSRGLPLLGICRGMQEMNVALGGSLHARVHDLPERQDHRRPQHPELDVQYGPKHEITLVAGGYLHRLLGATRITVNSLHNQALARLAPSLAVEATADDGTIEAVRVESSPGFALGVQWHPEYKPLANPTSLRIFQAFGEALRTHARARIASLS